MIYSLYFHFKTIIFVPEEYIIRGYKRKLSCCFLIPPVYFFHKKQYVCPKIISIWT